MTSVPGASPQMTTSKPHRLADVFRKSWLRRFFTYHAPTKEQAERYSDIRAKAHDLAERILDSCPPSNELSRSIECLRECVMWANASIACNESEEN